MFRQIALIAAAFACMAAAAPSRPASPKPAPARPPAGAKPAADFDARNPADLVALLGTVGAKAEIVRSQDDAVYLRVAAPAYSFNAQFAGCNAQHRACHAVVYAEEPEKGQATLIQLNGFNQTSVLCRAYQDRLSKPHVAYATLVTANDTPETVKVQLAAWQGCLADFGDFLADPNAFLATAP